MRIRVFICSLLTIILMNGCGSVSEFPADEISISKLTVSTVASVKSDMVASWGDDYVDTTKGLGDPDEGALDCYFTFDSISEPAGLLEVVTASGNCTDPFNCAVCNATKDNETGDCALNCDISAFADPNFVGEYIDVQFNARLVVMTGVTGSSKGMVRMDLDGLAGHQFDLNTGSVNFYQAKVGGSEDAGIIFNPGTSKLNSTTDLIDYTIEISSTVVDEDGMKEDTAGDWLDYNSDKVGDYNADDSSCKDPVCIVHPGDIWGVIEATGIQSRINLDELAVPGGTLTTVDLGTVRAVGALWQDAASNHDISNLEP